ncbi:MAG: hypothetical protein AB9888_15080 [Bacteroidales bacterium]
MEKSDRLSLPVRVMYLRLLFKYDFAVHYSCIGTTGIITIKAFNNLE